MQSTRQTHTHQAQPERLIEKKVADLMEEKRRLVEVPYTATLADTMNTLQANRVAAVPVAAPPGQWIGAGGSMILEYDKRTGAARKHYIGMVTMLDIMAHIAGDGDEDDVADLDPKMAVSVSSIIGHCLESLNLWTLNPSMSLVDCMEVFSKGIHRAMVPLEGQAENLAGVELAEYASSYRMLTQMDLLKFMREYDRQHDELKGIMSHHIKDSQRFQGVTDPIFGVTDKARVIDAIKCMRAASLSAVPVVESSISIHEDHRQLVNGKNRKVIATFSATDLRGCPMPLLEACLKWTVVDFLRKLSESPLHETSGLLKELVACNTELTLGEAVEKAVCNGVHRVWVVDDGGLLQGVVSITDMIRVIRLWLLRED